MTKDKVLIGLIIVAFVVGVWWIAGKAGKQVEQCHDAGGLIVQTPSGWTCVKVEKL